MTTRSPLSLLGLAVLPVVLAGATLTAYAQTKDPSAAESPSAIKDKAASGESPFKRADANGDGKISKEEAAKVPGLAARFDELDKNKDGVLTADELTASPKPGQ